MGPSVKFVSHIIDDQWFIFKIKGVNFFLDKRPRMRGGEGFRERFGKRRQFFRFFLAPFPYLVFLALGWRFFRVADEVGHGVEVDDGEITGIWDPAGLKATDFA